MIARRRGTIPADEARRVWAASAGRCAICGRYLLEGHLTAARVRLGELAHIAGATDAAGSPRGGGGVPLDQRDRAENLMLICAGEHDEIDRDGVVDLLTVERLRAIKRDHEDWIRTVGGLPRNRGTAVIRMIGNIRGNAVELSRATAAATVVRCDSRFPEFPLSLNREGIEIDLRGLPAEASGDPIYWNAAQAKIDEAMARLREAVEAGAATHLSIFAFGRLPLLVYLGSRLDDTVGTVVYQRHRATEGWDWPEGAAVTFVANRQMGPTEGDVEAVLVLNVSGSIGPGEVPEAIGRLPRLSVEPSGVTPNPDVLMTRGSVASFATCIRELFADLEARAKSVRRLHVLAALPVSAAVTLGMSHDPHIHPTLVVYDRTLGGYASVMEVGR